MRKKVTKLQKMGLHLKTGGIIVFIWQGGHAHNKSEKIMTNENNILKINSKIEKLTEKFGGHENACCLEAPYHACNPNRPNGWQASAVRITGNVVEHGRLEWGFGDWVEENGERDDAADYPWDDCDGFETAESFDLEDEDDMKLVMELLK